MELRRTESLLEIPRIEHAIFCIATLVYHQAPGTTHFIFMCHMKTFSSVRHPRIILKMCNLPMQSTVHMSRSFFILLLNQIRSSQCTTYIIYMKSLHLFSLSSAEHLECCCECCQAELQLMFYCRANGYYLKYFSPQWASGRMKKCHKDPPPAFPGTLRQQNLRIIAAFSSTTVRGLWLLI